MKGLSDAALRRLRDAADAPDLTGTKYEVIECIGQGGMGTVYRARDRELGRDVALKVVRLPEASPDVGSRMLREARTLASLEHPGIVPVHDAGWLPDGRAYYAMKLVRGAPLDALPPMPLRERLRIVERIAEAVAFAHAHGVIHRDLKPQNVMVGPFGEVLVMDWGVAKLVSAAARAASVDVAALGAGPGRGTESAGDAMIAASNAPATDHGVVLGTPGYMAPEQAAGDTAVDARADVHALGALLRDLASAPESSTSTAAGAVTLPRPLAAMVRKAMAPDPANRYASVSDLARDVAAFRAGDPVSAYRENPIERLRRLAVRYSTPLLLIAAYLLMRVTLLAVRGR